MPTEDEYSEWERCCRAAVDLQHEHEVFNGFVTLAEMLGYSYATFGLKFPTSFVAPRYSFYANYLPDWSERFVAQKSSHHGSYVAKHKRTVEPQGRDVYNWAPQDFDYEAELHGIHFDDSRTMPGEFGTVARIGVAGNSRPRDPVLRRKTKMMFDWVIRMMNLRLITKNLPQCEIVLTNIEREYLLWVLDGRPQEELAGLMHVNDKSIKAMYRELQKRFDRRSIYTVAAMAREMKMLG